MDTPHLFPDLYAPGPCLDPAPEPALTCAHGTLFPAPGSAAAPCCEAEADRLIDEHDHADTYTGRVLAYLTDRPLVWVDGLELAAVGGAYAWRTRVSEARKRLEAAKRGTIENELIRLPTGVTRSRYRFVPAGVDAGT